MSRRFSRRSLIERGAGVAALALGGEQRAHAATPAAPETVIVVCLCGGADGLSLIVPYASEHYHRARPHTAIAPPGRAPGSALPLDAEHGLHPGLAPLRPLFERGELGALVGVGLPARVRSHVLAWREVDRRVALALGGTVPERLSGSFPRQVAEACALLRTPRPPRALRLESLGWDTHVAQGDASGGRLARAVAELGAGLVALRNGLAERRDRTLIVVLTEFGRSVAETPMAGTDDGHGSALLVLGGPRFGEVIGPSFALAPAALSEGRHVPVALDVGVALERLVRREPLRS